MTTKIELYEEIVKRIGEYTETDVSGVTPETRIVIAFPDLDSLQLLEMLVYLEETMGVEINESVLDKFETVGNLVDYIYDKKFPQDS